MADYKISLGAELRTGEIDKEVKKYKGEVNLDVNSSSIINGIDTAIKGYKAPQPIEVMSKLNTQGITDEITKYSSKENRKKIKVGIDPDHLFDGIETIIGNKTFNTPLSVKVELNWAGVAQQIADFKATAQKSGEETEVKVKLNAELDTDAVSTAVKNFNVTNSATMIKVNVDPQFDRVNEKIKSYVPKTLMKINAKVNKNQIDESIENFSTSKYVKLKAQLPDNAIEQAITKYKPTAPVPVMVDFKVGSTTEVDNKIASYEGTPVSIKTKLVPASRGFATQITKEAIPINVTLNNADDINTLISGYKNSPVPVAAKLIPGKNFVSEITKTPIPIEAELVPDAINKAITNPSKPFNKIPIGVELTTSDTSDINGQIQKLNSLVTESLDVDVKLNEESVNKAITVLKPTTPLDVNVKLIDDNINQQIEAIHPTSPIKVNIKVNDNDVDEKTGAQKTQDPINVNVKLDREDINTQIREFKTKTKIKVGVKLDFASHKDESGKEIQKGIAKQIKEHETKSKIKIGAQLDKDAVNKAIQDFETDVPIKLGVELDTESAKKQIEELKEEFKKFGNITINFGGNAGTSGVGASASGGGISDVANQFREADIRIATTGDHLKNLEQALESVGFGKNQINNITKEFDELGISVRNVTSRLHDDGSVTLTVKGVDQFERAVKIMKRVDADGVHNLGTTISQDFKETEDAFKRLKSLAKDIGNLNVEISGLDADKNKAEIEGLISKLNRLQSEYDELYSITEKNLSSSQIGALDEEFEKAIDKLEQLDNKMKDTSIVKEAKDAQKEIDKAFSEMEKKKKSIGALEVKLAGLDENSEKDIPKIEKIEVALKRLRTEYSALEENFGSFLSSEQLEKLGVIAQETADKIDLVKAGLKGSAAAKVTVDGYNELLKLTKQIEDIDSRIRKLKAKDSNIDIKTDSSELKILESDLLQLRTTYNKIKESLNGKLTAEQDAKVDAVYKKMESDLMLLDAQINDTRANLAKGIELKIDSGKLSSEVAKINSDVKKLTQTYPELSQELEKLNALEKEMSSNVFKFNNADYKIEKYKKYEEILEKVQNQLKKLKIEESDKAAEKKLENDRIQFQHEIDAWLKKNSAAAGEFGDRLNDLKERAKSADKTKLDNLCSELKQIDKEAEAAGKKMQTFGDRLKEQFNKYSAYFGISEIFMWVEQGLRDMFEQVKLIDSAMTELKKVTNETDASYNQFLSRAATKAKEIGTTIDGLVASTADFARLGYNFADSQGLAEVANIYAVVGDEIDGVEDATQSLISTLAAFKGEIGNMDNSEFALSIVDKMNEVANNYAISSGGIGEALQRSASSMAAANNTLDETIAMITAANEVAQDPEKVGNAMKTISMRIRGAKTELEEAGESTDGMAESTAKLRQEIMALSGVDIMLNETTFKSTYQIMDELSEKWESLSDIAQASITELMAGKHQGNIMSSLMSNFDTARKALETSLNSAGSAMQEHEKWQQSLEARILSLKASWQGLSQTFLSSDFLKVCLDGVIGLVDGVSNLIDTFGAVPTILGTVAAGLSAFNNKGFFTFEKDTKSIKLFGNNLSSLGKNIGEISSSINIYNSNLNKSTELQNEHISSLSKNNGGLSKYLSGLKGAKASFGGYISSLVGATAKTIALEVATIALNAAITMGISAIISFAFKAIDKLIVTSDELAEKVEEVTSKYKEQHRELKNLKNDYDTSKESSMISKYEELSRGVDNLGRNVSLTADEYLEYQGIVNTIAEQIPSLVSGYDKHGNAILSCKGNVEELRKEYEKLIHAQNNEILSKAGDIEKNFANTLKESTNDGFWNSNTTIEDIENLEYIYKKGLKTDEEISEYLNNVGGDIFGIAAALEDAGVEGADWAWGTTDSNISALSKQLASDSSKIKGVIDNYYSQFSDDVEKQKTIAQAKLSEAFDVSSVISGLNYGNIGEELQEVAYQVVNGLDFDFFSQLSKDGITVEQWVTDMLNQLNSLEDVNSTKIESAFDLKTEFNGGKISYGEYVDGLEDVGTTIEKLYLKDEFKAQLKISLGLNEDGLVEEYKALKNKLADSEKFDIMPEDYEPFLDSLSAGELSVLVDIIPELQKTDYKETIQDIKAALEREMAIQGLTFDLNLEVESAGIDALNTALSESVTASGLSVESIDAIRGRYAELEAEGYDLSSMFEETSHGIHLNRQEFNKLEKEYSTKKLTEINGQLEKMQSEYDKLGKDIRNCTDPVEKAKLFSDRQLLAQRISEAGTLAAQYQGLTSAYNDWLAAEEAGSERDMYENIISGFESVGDEISRGWMDDGTIEFLKLLKGEKATIIDGDKNAKEISIATASAQELKQVWKDLDNNIQHTTYSIRDFFTVDEDGNSTSQGVYNFLDAIGQLEEEAFDGKDVVERNENGKIIGFDFQVVGGDKAIADALGISEELVQIMKRAADDAGFVVSFDGTYKQFADLQNEAENAVKFLKNKFENGEVVIDLGIDYEFDFDSTSIKSLESDLVDANKILDEFKDKDGNINLKASGATEAMTVVSTLQARLDTLKQEQYGIGLTVEDEEFEEPLENLQEYGRTITTLNQLKINPNVNAEEIEQLEGNLEEIAKYFANLDDDIKVKLGFEADDNWEEVQKKIESGEVTIPTTLDIQTNMDKNIEDLKKIALLGSGLLSEDQEERLKLEILADVDIKAGDIDDSDVDEKVDDATSGGGGNKNAKRQKHNKPRLTTRKTNIEIIAETVGIEDVDNLTSKLKGLDDKTIQAIAEVVGQIDVDKLKQTIAMLEPKTVEAIAKAIGEGDVDGLKTAINQLSPKTVQAIAEALGYGGVNELNTAIENLDPKTVQAVAEALGITDVESLKSAIDKLKPKTVTAKAQTSGQSKVQSLIDTIKKLKDKTINIVTNFIENVASGGKKKASQRTGVDLDGSGVNGTANVNGTTGRAFKQGNWGTKYSGTALVGELGREILVRNGRYYTIGDTGAEFIKYKPGDIIFNHKQTEELFANGRVTSGRGRAKALVEGTAFVGGNSQYSGLAFEGGIEPEVKSYPVGKNKNTGKTYYSSKDKDKDSDSAEEFQETIDLIEIAISRIEREIDNLDSKANNIYKTWSERNKALTKQISKVSEEINLQQNAYDEYMKAAAGVGLSSDWVKKIQNGEVDIETITDEVLKEKIGDYQDYYEKALDCKDAIEELKETEASLYAQRLENVSAQYDGVLGVIEHEKNMLEEYISQAEAKGHLVSAEYYEALADNERKRVEQLRKQKNAMLAELEKAMESGTIEKYSQSWYEMCAEIDDVTLAIEESNTALLEYEQTLQQLSWETFDILQEKISDVNDEADFLIELMSHKDLYDDNGKLTEEGKAVMGLHGQKYNTYMHQADKYAEEVDRLNKEIEKDPYDQELIDRRDELIKLQRESILAAEDEKEAIKDLVEEGHDRELEALQEKIDKKKEALRAEKELYDYNKKVKEQTKEISSLEKQLAAYANDDSEEAKAKIQQIKVDLEEARENLEETQYDKYISDQEEMLDSMYEQYEETLNSRFDNTDALISDVVNEVNANSSSISETLTNTADSVGYELSESMQTIWNSSTANITGVITTYGDNFSNAQTTTNNALNTINTNLQNVIGQLNKIANTDVDSASNSSADQSKEANAEDKNGDKKPSNTPSTPPTSSPSTPTIKEGGKINAGSAKIYDYAGDTSGENQYYKNDPIYKVLKIDGNWLQVRHHKLSSGITGWFKKGDVKAYATGKKNFLGDEIAWTQDGGQEYIIRPSDGAILTPIAKGDSVLNAQASNNIWNMANSPAEFIKDNLNLGTGSVPNNSNVQSSYSQYLDKVVINLPNVKNYEQFLEAMQKDRNFEKLIQSMTIDKIAGKSSLAKGKSIR